jgi:hypothetical protein
MKAFLTAVIVAVVIAVGAGYVMETSNTSVSDAYATPSVRNN